MLGIIDVGGGTRGIFGTGVLDFCMDNNIRCDYFIGVSAGSANGSSYLSGQVRRNHKFYTEYAFRREYMGIMQLLKTRNFINLDYVYSTLSNSDGEYPLDYSALRDNPAKFEIVATDGITGKPRYFSKEDMTQDNYDVIKASCCVPAVCKPYYIDGVPYYDGGMSDPIPYRRAFEMGCDKVVVILTRPKDSFRGSDRDLKIARRIRRKFPNAAKAIASRGRVYNKQLKYITELEREGKLLIVAPDDISGLKTLTKDLDQLEKLYHKGYAEGVKILRYLRK